MREILFRAWDGHKMITDGLVIYNGDLYMDWRDFEDGITSDNPLMQYTGLKDKNGVKIFEGDILHDEGHMYNGEVVYKTEYGGWWYFSKSGFGTSLEFDDFDELTVIGNIHDNPEMMEGTK